VSQVQRATANPAHASRIVCLAGSAGALCAYQEILRNLPGHTGMVFVIVSHRGPKLQHLLREVLSVATSMPVIEVEQGMFLMPDQVYLMPPGVEMTVSEEHMFLTKGPDRNGWPVSISIFLRSLAESATHRAIAIILSGVGFDGSSEMAAIKASGGVTFAQSDAEFRDMPDSAVKTGHVDFVLSPAGIVRELLALSAPVRLRLEF
jgi:two-component system CheB/CheR fusion protein